GEALVRNLLFGAADAEHWGARLDVLYSPDAFGHPGILPTLAREFGLRSGVVWRGLGGERGQERDLYRWCGPDGKEILLWHLPPPAPRRVLPGGGGARQAGAARARGRAALVVPLRVDAAGRARHPCSAQAAQRGARAVAGAVRRAARGPRPAAGRARPARAARP